jgi:proton-translocating NADH-quinone oxidoreductase chain L
MEHWQAWLYVAAVLLPLASFTVQILGMRILGNKSAYVATATIATCFGLSVFGLFSYITTGPGIGAFTGLHAHHDDHGSGESGHGNSGHDVHSSESHSTQSDHAPASGDHKSSDNHDHGKPHDSPKAVDDHSAKSKEGGGSSDGTDSASGHSAKLVWKGEFIWTALGSTLGQPLTLSLGVYIDLLSALMFSMVSFIAMLVHIYAMEYMHGDPRYPRFFAYLSLFCFSMFGLIASPSIFMIFVFWELVGVCSYFLIGFWFEDINNAKAALKAFVTNRVGDVGMLIGLGLIWSYFGTFNIADINNALSDSRIRDNDTRITRAVTGDDITVSIQAPPNAKGEPGSIVTKTIPYLMLTIAGLGIFAGCAGKSAQIPLHVWLPDAMAGPTPVSALIHAATMVAAGVYLVGRFYALFTAEALLYIAYTGGLTMIVAATIALVQTDYKKVLAYSTISQLGMMMLGLGSLGFAAGLFHLITHAFFKALLFLSAGSIYHSVHTYEMPKLGGLLKKMPITGYCMLAATMAISGVPLLSGFYSKDAILAATMRFASETGHYPIFFFAAFGSALTAFYMFRMWFLVFDGTSRSAHLEHEPHDHHGHDDHGHGHHGDPVAHAHESGPKMAWPLIALTIPTIIVGYPISILPFGEPILEQMIHYSAPVATVDLSDWHFKAMMVSFVVASLGIGGSALFYSRFKIFSPEPYSSRFSMLYNLFVNKWYFDKIYSVIFVKPTMSLAHNISKFDKLVVDGMVTTASNLTHLASQASSLFDRSVVDGMVNSLANLVMNTGEKSRQLQTGKLRQYLAVLAVGVVGLFGWLYIWIQS